MQLICIIMTKINPTEILKKSKLKVTTGRVQILKILIEAKYPADVTQIIARLRASMVKIDQVTVYRILDKYIDKKIIEKTEFQEGKYRYEFVSSNHHHHHAVCLECGLINDINNCEINSAEENITRDIHFKVQNHHLEFFGLCEKCQ